MAFRFKIELNVRCKISPLSLPLIYETKQNKMKLNKKKERKEGRKKRKTFFQSFSIQENAYNNNFCVNNFTIVFPSKLYLHVTVLVLMMNRKWNTVVSRIFPIKFIFTENILISNIKVDKKNVKVSFYYDYTLLILCILL